jgi:hypothetical protein
MIRRVRRLPRPETIHRCAEESRRWLRSRFGRDDDEYEHEDQDE